MTISLLSSSLTSRSTCSRNLLAALLLSVALVGLHFPAALAQELVGDAAESEDNAAANEEQPTETPENGEPPVDVLAELDLSTPRATLDSFLSAMNSVDSGKPEFMEAALACFNLEDVAEEQREAEGRRLALPIYQALNSVGQLDRELIPESYEERDFKADIGELADVPLHFRHNDDGNWRFSRSRSEDNLDLYREIAQSAIEAAVPVDARVDPDIANPRATMQTFLAGMDILDDGGREQVIKTFDVSHLGESVRDETAINVGSRLQSIMDRDRYVLPQDIPDHLTGSPYVHLSEGGFTIEIVPIPVEADSAETETDAPVVVVYEWKFSGQTVDNAEALWDIFRDRDLAVASADDTSVPYALQIQDWIARKFPVLKEETLSLENWQWLGLLLIVLLGMMVSRLLTLILIRAIRRYFRREDLFLDVQLEKDFVKPLRVAIMARVWWLALKPLNLPPSALDVLKIATSTISTLALVWALYRLIDIVGEFLSERAERTETKKDDMVVPLIVRTAKIATIVVGVFLTAKALSLPYETILTVGGVGGVAIAFAAKDTVGNVFGSLAILFDRPFEIGDWVTIGDVDGNVEKVGIRSTRVRTFYNSLITVPNSVIINATIDNYGQRRFRRIRIFLGVTYDTPPDKIEAFCEGIREIIRQHPYTRKDYYHVYLNNFSDSSLDILLYCFQECPDWSTELRERQRLFLDILRLAKRLGVEFAFPTQTLFMNPDSDGAKSDENGLDTNEALAMGQKAARAIVEEGMGKNPPLPPPVSFGPTREKPVDGFDEEDGE